VVELLDGARAIPRVRKRVHPPHRTRLDPTLRNAQGLECTGKHEMWRTDTPLCILQKTKYGALTYVIQSI